MKTWIFSIFLFPFFTSISHAQGLVDALDLQFKKYDEARKSFIVSVVDNDEHISRPIWEVLLEPEIEINEQQLRARQWVEIKKSALQAQLDSKNLYKVKIDEFRSSSEKVKLFCETMPKGAMLHVHADGTLDRQTVKDILEQANPKVNGVELLSRVKENGFSVYLEERQYLESLSQTKKYEALESKGELRELFFLPKEPYSHDFSRFMAFFFIKGIIYKGEMSYGDVTEKIYRDFLKRAQKNKILYVEISDAQLKPKSFSIAKLKKLAELGREYGVTLKWNISFYRNIDAKSNEEKMKKWIDFLKANPTDLITGIDFIADESIHPALEKGQGVYAQAYQANKLGLVSLHRTMHAGELGHPKNVRDAMIMGAERVGHGVKLWQDPVALEYARKIKLGIETNLVSNYRLQVVKDKNNENCSSAFCDSDHPFIKFLRLGLPVSFSTDDEGLFETTMSKECEVAIRTTDIQYSELRQIAINAIDSSFASSETKALLKNQLLDSLKKFEESQY